LSHPKAVKQPCLGALGGVRRACSQYKWFVTASAKDLQVRESTADPKTDSQAKIIPLRPSSKTKLDTNTVKLLKIADEIDHVILRHVEAGDVDLKELAGLLSHRLGALVKHLENKEALVDVCVDVLKKQAAVDE
jgi:hypothetical protein